MKRIFVYKHTIFLLLSSTFCRRACMSKTFFLRFIKQIHINIYIRFPNTVLNDDGV